VITLNPDMPWGKFRRRPDAFPNLLPSLRLSIKRCVVISREIRSADKEGNLLQRQIEALLLYPFGTVCCIYLLAANK
jgi:hypothetical protein